MNEKTIQLCGLGNGLVDMQFRISDAIIEKLNIPKGEMRLIEELEQLSIIDLLKNVVPNRCSGGSATNTLYAFAQFGGKGAYLTSVGNDGNGKYYYDEVAKVGIKYKPNIIENKPTGTCLILITPDGERTMLTCLAASQDFNPQHLDEELIATSEWLYIEGYKLSETLGADSVQKAIKIAKKNGTKISLTASDVFIINACRDNFMNVLSNADLIFCNKNEVKAITNTDNIDEAFEKLKQLCPNVVLTMGADGAMAFIENKKYIFSAVAASVLDTTGAGDMYAGAFLFGLLNFDGENKIERAGKLASLSSSLIVSRLGARYTGDLKKLIIITR
jgi:sugar/nucleoside kinase (ribokinase family)